MNLGEEVDSGDVWSVDKRLVAVGGREKVAIRSSIVEYTVCWYLDAESDRRANRRRCVEVGGELSLCRGHHHHGFTFYPSVFW